MMEAMMTIDSRAGKKPMRILIADDQPDVIEALRLVLKGEGFQTETASSPFAILRAVESRDVDLVLMDLNYARDTTSGQEGLEVLSRLHAMDSSIPVVVMTAWGSVDLAVEAMRRGARDFVLKPWENARLVGTLRRQTAESLSRAAEREDHTESERLAAFDMESARQVQSALFPRGAPDLRTLECAGACIEAGAVGGDYYDFLHTGPGCAAFVLADASGKGVSAALLMAHLQASLRSQIALARRDAPSLLRSVNRLFNESSEPGRYATLFFAQYDDATRNLRYVNCGHNPPILLRRDGGAERLHATATVLGLIEDWTCTEEEIAIARGDTLAIFSDGVTEARNDMGEEFGDERLLESLRSKAGAPAEKILAAVIDQVRAFSGDRLEDDATLVVLPGR